MLKAWNSKKMDWIYLRTKFGCAQFKHLQAIISHHQDLPSPFQCLEAEICAFFDANSCLTKNWAQTCWPFGLVHSNAGSVNTPRNFHLLKKTHCPFSMIMYEVSGKSNCCFWLRTKLTLIFCDAGEFSHRQFAYSAKLKTAFVWNMQQWCWRTDQAFRVLQEALCESMCSSHAKMTLHTMEGSSAQQTWQNLVFPGFHISPHFPNFFLFPQKTAGPRVTAAWQCALRIDAKRRKWILNWRCRQAGWF